MGEPGRERIERSLGELDELTRTLRRECPWDREQDERSIVPHTVEEAFELADAANSGDDAALLDELGDVLFQVHFLSLLMEERGAGDLAVVADACREKLIRRHPHVFGEVEVESADEVLGNWDEIKRGEPGRQPGIFSHVPENLPATLLARKVQRRAASSGFDPGEAADAAEAAAAQAQLAAQAAGGPGSEEAFEAVGDLLFAAVNLARRLKVDPELALRASSERFRGRVEAAERAAGSAGREWGELTPEEQLQFYVQSRLEEEA
ncbi:MAG: nucleoside triphosphate pyrophosphohydrolase [Acidobacteria bacterium]|nr:nucleoside triphosphate pyrophosphohydrolase [Acidobacteriota bacterium]